MLYAIISEDTPGTLDKRLTVPTRAMPALPAAWLSPSLPRCTRHRPGQTPTPT